jgi:hypothetical protein
VDEEEVVDEVLETVVEVALLLVTLLDVVVVLLLATVEVAAPGPAMKYPPTPATTKAIMITTAATVVEIPVLERRTISKPSATRTHSPQFAHDDT